MTGLHRLLAIGAVTVAGLWPWPRPAPPAPPAPPADPLATGARIYTAACLSCHGPRGDGRALWPLPDGRTAPPLDRLDPEQWPPQRVRAVIARGRPPMPGWAAVLDPKELDAVTRYVLSLRPQSGPGPAPSGAQGRKQGVDAG